MALKAIWFDLDDTLLWDDRSIKEAFQVTCQHAAQVVAINPDDLELAVRREARALYESYDTFSFTQNIGINPFEGLWAHFTGGQLPQFRALQQLAPLYRKNAWMRGLLALGINQPELALQLAEQFPRERRARPLVYEETFSILDQLKGKYRLLLLTNGAPDLQNEKINMLPQLRSYFQHIVISGDFGEGKPSPNLFRHACSLIGIEPLEGIMIGDKLTTDILGSQQIGMPNIWINHHGVQHDGKIKPLYEVTRLSEIIPIIERF
jgi:putative hydrolase of the HAD superfamily